MGKLNSLTPAQEKTMFEVRDFWNNYIDSCKNTINQEEAKLGIEWLYEFSKCDKPKIIFVESPLGCQYAVYLLKGYLKALQAATGERSEPDNKLLANVRDNVWDNVGASVRDNVGDNVLANVWDNVRDSVWDNVWDNVGANVWANVGDNVLANVWDNVRDNVRDSVWDNVWDNVGANVWANVWANVGDNVGRAILNEKLSYESFSTYGNIGDYSWVSFYDFFTQIGVVNHEGFNKFRKLLLSGVYDMIQLNGFCIVCGLPSKLTRGAENRLHNTTGSAIQWNDGYELFYINGRSIPAEHFKAICDKTFKMEDFINEQNEEHKSSCIALMQEKYGDEYIVHFFSEYMKEVDTFVDKKDKVFLKGTTGGMNIGVYTLFKGEINDEEIAYVRCYCPSTDRMFFLGVESIHTTAKDAIASLYRVPRKLINHIESISRQGERYNTTFNQEGNEVLSALTEKEIADLASIDGKKYFDLIKYEY